MVRIGGRKISPISYCSINQRIDWHHSFEVLIPTDGFTKKNSTILNQAKDFIGEKIEIAFKVKKPEESDIQNEFIGIVTEVSLNRRNKGEKEIFVRGYSPTILMDGRPNCQAYKEMSLTGIVTDLFSNIPQNDLKTQVRPGYRTDIPYIVQYKESNFHFLNRIADRYGEWCFYNGTELIFGKLEKDQKTNLPIDKNLSEFEFSIRILNLNYNAVTYDYSKNNSYQKDTKDFQVNDLDLYGDHALTQSEKTYKQENTFYSSRLYPDERNFNEFYQTRKFENTKDLIFNEGSSDNPYINVGSVINVTGESKGEEDYGEFIIITINHSIDVTGNYVNSFSAIPAQANTPPVNRNITQPLSEVQPAVVTDNNDPDKLGRIKVRFFWKENDETPWLRLIHSHAGKAGKHQHGFYFIPEIDDEVMIGFENDNPDRPFVLGNVYHGKSSADYWHHAENNIKSIRTRNGNQLIFIDEDGKEEIRLLNKDDTSPTNEISLSLNDKGKITIKSVGELEISAESIKINADTDLTVESGKTTKFSANDYKLDANNGLELKGQQVKMEGTNTSMKGSAQLKMEGKQTDISATMLKAEGSATTEIKGTAVSINGSATAELKGALVKIN